MIMPPSRKRVMITGVTGQDGGLMARKLLDLDCRVCGLVPPKSIQDKILMTCIKDKMEVVTCDLGDRDVGERVVSGFQPEIIFHLAAQSSVRLAWDDPMGTARVNSMGAIHLLDAVRNKCPECMVVMAGSCDCFDHEVAGEEGVTVDTPILATNPYSVSKIMAHRMAHCYRDEFGMRVSVGILFNHTSPGRPELFIERRIVRGLVRIALGQKSKLVIGSIDRKRDWSWADDIVDGFSRMGMLDKPADVVLASGKLHRIGDWAEIVCSYLDLDIGKVIEVDDSRNHPGDRDSSFGNINAAKELLGWEPSVSFEEIARRLVQHDLAELKQ